MRCAGARLSRQRRKLTKLHRRLLAARFLKDRVYRRVVPAQHNPGLAPKKDLFEFLVARVEVLHGTTVEPRKVPDGQGDGDLHVPARSERAEERRGRRWLC